MNTGCDRIIQLGHNFVLTIHIVDNNSEIMGGNTQVYLSKG